MRLLLDTHILLALTEKRTALLGRDIEALLSSGAHDLFASVACLWEITIKWRSGRLAVSIPPADLAGFLGALGIEILPVSAGQVVAPFDPAPPTRDPFDRLYLSICRHEGLHLVTIDRALVDHPLAWRPAATA